MINALKDIQVVYANHVIYLIRDNKDFLQNLPHINVGAVISNNLFINILKYQY